MIFNIIETDAFDIAYFQASTGKLIEWKPQVDPLARAEAVRNAYSLWQGNKDDSYFVSGGMFDFGYQASLLFPGCLTQALESTVFFGSVLSDDPKLLTNFQLNNGTTLDTLTLVQSCSVTAEDGRCVGFEQPYYSAKMRRCTVWGREWALYNWQNGTTLLFEDGKITGGRVCIAAENSGVGQYFTIRNTDVIGDCTLSQSSTGNAVSDPVSGGVFGVVARGGEIILDNVRFSLTGQAIPPRACCVTDHGGRGDGPAANTQLLMRNISCAIDPNGSPNFWDIDIQDVELRKKYRILGGNGSKPDGSFLVS